MGRDRNGPATIFQLYVRTCLARPNIAESTQGPAYRLSRNGTRKFHAVARTGSDTKW